MPVAVTGRGWWGRWAMTEADEGMRTVTPAAWRAGSGSALGPRRGHEGGRDGATTVSLAALSL